MKIGRPLTIQYRTTSASRLSPTRFPIHPRAPTYEQPARTFQDRTFQLPKDGLLDRTLVTLFLREHRVTYHKISSHRPTMLPHTTMRLSAQAYRPCSPSPSLLAVCKSPNQSSAQALSSSHLHVGIEWNQCHSDWSPNPPCRLGRLMQHHLLSLMSQLSNLLSAAPAPAPRHPHPSISKRSKLNRLSVEADHSLVSAGR